MTELLWWVRHILLAVAGLFFMGFGVLLLIAAYGLKDPFHFVMTFFASNLIILISAALLVGFIFRMVAALSRGKDDIDESPPTEPG
jgi:hypothetical protein